MNGKPFSEACERNRAPILGVLKDWFILPGRVLEIGSGTGQHAVYFAEHLPHLTWVAADREENLAGIAQWISEAGLPNLQGPHKLDVRSEVWPLREAKYAFTANTTHIMSWPEVECMFAGVSAMLDPGGKFCVYGPFNRNGEFTSDSNRQFDEMLRSRNPAMGIRDDRALITLAQRCELTFAADYALPANNRVMVWSKA
jgi:cyclopropane fatty-acyl-phospholipid synthase-like methyltransferase